MRMLAPIALAGAMVLTAVTLLGGSGDGYTAELRMPNAGGLKDGSPVTVGGIRVGKVDVDVDVDRQVAVARLHIQDEYAPLRRDARAAIVAQNLLGQKQVQLTPGSGPAAPSGFVIPRERITEATDLDRVLSVLDADTRTRLAIFINEAGAAFTGRRADFNRFLRDIAPAIGDATDVVGQLAADNASLGRLVETSDRYVAEANARRDDVIHLVDRVGRAAEIGATKRAELRGTLAEAPGALQTLQRFLGELRATTVPLGPAARQLSAAAGPLRATLDQLEPFRHDAQPALETATRVAPMLDRLATRATPVLREAVPTLQALRTLATDDLPGVLDVTDRGLNNALAVADNWSGAIQFRDRLSHVFRGEASFNPDAVDGLVRRLAPGRSERRSRSRRAGRAERPSGGDRSEPPRAPTAGQPGLPLVDLPELGGAIDDTVTELEDTVRGGRGSGSSDTGALLDFLLGS